MGEQGRARALTTVRASHRVRAMLVHIHGDRRQLEDLSAMRHSRRQASLQAVAAARAALRPVLDDLIELGVADELAGRAFVTTLTTGLRPVGECSRRGAPGSSLDGGVDEFDEFSPNRSSSRSTRASSRPI